MSLAKQQSANSQNKRRRVQIDEVNIATNSVTGKDQYGLTFQITYGPYYDGNVVSFPKQGENWIIEQYRQEWRLKFKAEDLTQFPTFTFAPGDKLINAGTLWLNGNANLINGFLTLNDPTDPQHAATKDYVDNLIGSGSSVISVFGRSGIVTAQTGDYSVSQITGAAPLVSPTFTGTPTAPTPALGDDSTVIPTTHWVRQQGYISSSLVTSVFSRTGAVTAQSGDYTVSQITGAAPLASPIFTGTPAAPTPTSTDNSTKIATTAYVKSQGYITSAPVTSVFTRTGAVTAQTGDYTVSQITGAAPLSSPTFTGTPAAPTAAVDTNTTQLATTAFVLGQATSTTPVMDGTAAVGTSTRYARGDHTHPTDTSRAPLASPTFTGTPTAPTATAGTNTTQLATTAFVHSAVATGGSTISTFSSGPPLSPSDGDIWFATNVDAIGTRWQFQYNAGSSSTYKWEFVGGASTPLFRGSTDSIVSNNVITADTNLGTLTAQRPGEYFTIVNFWIFATPPTNVQIFYLHNGLNAGNWGATTSTGTVVLQGTYISCTAGSDTIGVGILCNSATGVQCGPRSLQVIPRRVS